MVVVDVMPMFSRTCHGWYNRHHGCCGNGIISVVIHQIVLDRYVAISAVINGFCSMHHVSADFTRIGGGIFSDFRTTLIKVYTEQLIRDIV